MQKALGWHPLTIWHVIITHCYQQLGTRQLASNAERLGNNQSLSFRKSDRRCILHLRNTPVLKRDNCKDDLRRIVSGYGYRCRSHMLFVLIKQLAAVCFSLICLSAKSDVWKKKRVKRASFNLPPSLFSLQTCWPLKLDFKDSFCGSCYTTRNKYATSWVTEANQSKQAGFMSHLPEWYKGQHSNQ